MFLFSNVDHVQEILSFLGSNPNQEALKALLTKFDYTETDLQKLIEFIENNPDSPQSLSLAHGLFDTVRYAFRNTQLLYLIMEHEGTESHEKMAYAEKLVKRMEKLKAHPAYQVHQREYLDYEAACYRVIGQVRFEDGYPEIALTYYRRGLEFAIENELSELTDLFQRKISEADQKIKEDESLSKSLIHLIESLKAEIEEKQRELASLLQVESVFTLQEKIKEVERLANVIEERQIELDELLLKVRDTNEEIQISRTRLELLLAKNSELEKRTAELDHIQQVLDEQRIKLDTLTKQVADQQHLLNDLEKARLDAQLIEESIAANVDKLSGLDRQLKEKGESLAALEARERSLKNQIDELNQQEQALHQVVGELDEKIKKTIEYTYRQKELDDEQKRLALSMEKQNKAALTLNKTIDQLTATANQLRREIEKLHSEKAALQKGTPGGTPSAGAKP